MRTKLKFCHFPWTSLFVRKTGRIQPCCMNSTELGNIHDDTVVDAWNSATMQSIRDDIINGRYEEAGCSAECRVLNRFLRDGSVESHWPEQQSEHGMAGENLKQAIAAMQFGQLELDTFPLSFDIQSNELCNMKCFMCHQNHDDMEHLSVEILDKITINHDYILDMRFQGGEVFADKRFFDYLIRLRDKLQNHQVITVITNGSLLNKTMIDEMIDGTGRIKIMISVDSVYEDTYRKIRVTNQFDRVWENLSYMGKRQASFESKDIVLWGFMVTRSNLREIKSAIDAAQQLDLTISFNQIIGAYTGENLFRYPELFDQSDIQYIEDCQSYADSRQIRARGLAEILTVMRQKLQSTLTIATAAQS